ncbi:MAG: PGPGW domain-containing protein [Micrococcaceae bacterium]|nr:PGPGW domain-containing protein [Micrococcaceae bacterium]
MASTFVHVWLKPLAVNIAGWLLLVVGVLALVLPGPGLLCIVAGLAVLSTRYWWAEKLMHPVKARAYQLAAESVKTRWRIFWSSTGASLLLASGVVWGLRPPAPEWWRWPEDWWLIGGWGTALSIMASGGFALGLIIYTHRRFGLPMKARRIAVHRLAQRRGHRPDRRRSGRKEP